MVDKKLLFLGLLLFAGCTADPGVEEKIDSEVAKSPKIINSSANSEQGRLIVYFNDDAIESVEKSAAVTRSGLTRSGILSVDEVLEQLQATSLRRVFPYNAQSEARTREAGLHKWYVVTFDSQENLERAAQSLAAIGQIERVQFDTKLQLAYEGEARPLKTSAAATRAASSVFNDPELSSQWHYINTGDKGIATTSRVGADINAAEAWAVETGNPDVIVAIVDQGVKYTHPDLAANMWVNTAEQNGTSGVDDDGDGYVDDIHGYNFVTHGPISWNVVVGDKGDSGHGTHVAGTVAAVNNNGVGVCGVAGGSGKNDGVKLMSCQILSGTQGGTVAVSSEAIRYAADHGASIIQCSFGYSSGGFSSDASYDANKGVERAAIDYFIQTRNNSAVDGGLAIFSAGNETTAMAGYPGAYRDYISVTAFAPDLLPTYYTNYGPGANIAAPGGEYYITGGGEQSAVLSTLPSELYGSDYGYMQGTSMACPHVSGVAALGLSYALRKGRHYSLDEFKSMLLTSVNDMETYLDGTKASYTTLNLANYRGKMGTGAIDAYQLLMQIEGTPCLKVKVGVNQVVSLSEFFGGGSSSLTYTDVQMSAADCAKLGITTAPSIQYGKLKIKCTKSGVARITITAIAGGTNVGTPEQMGGMAVTKEFAVIARGVQTANGGWL